MLRQEHYGVIIANKKTLPDVCLRWTGYERVLTSSRFFVAWRVFRCTRGCVGGRVTADRRCWSEWSSRKLRTSSWPRPFVRGLLWNFIRIRFERNDNDTVSRPFSHSHLGPFFIRLTAPDVFSISIFGFYSLPIIIWHSLCFLIVHATWDSINFFINPKDHFVCSFSFAFFRVHWRSRVTQEFK